MTAEALAAPLVATPSSAEVALPLIAAPAWVETEELIPVWVEVLVLPVTSAEAAVARVAAARNEIPAAAMMRRIDFTEMDPFLLAD